MPACCVMCCGCQRLMDMDGKASIPFGLGGLIDVEVRLEVPVPNPLGGARVFQSHEDSDTACQEFGWSLIDKNHRCPECIKREQGDAAYEVEAARRGAYIDLPLRAETPVQRETEQPR